jgi:hypothetical protein
MRLPVRAVFAVTLIAACDNGTDPGGGPGYAIGLALVDSTVGSISDIALARDGGGKIHLAYSQDGISTLRYATCTTSCTIAAQWQVVTVDTAYDAGFAPSLAAGSGTALHIAYLRQSGPTHELRYATCAAGCTTAANWQVATVDAAGGYTPALALDGTGGVHVVENDLRKITYAACAIDCTAPANWQLTVLDSASYVGASPTALARDTAGVLHVLYERQDGSVFHLLYARCTGTCGDSANWTRVLVDSVAYMGAPALRVGAGGRLEATYFRASPGITLVYARCDSGCATAANWHSLALDATASAGYNGFIVSGAGAYVSYRAGGGDLRYAECAALCLGSGDWTFVSVDSLHNAFQNSALWAAGHFNADVAFLRAGDPGGHLLYAQIQPAMPD